MKKAIITCGVFILFFCVGYLSFGQEKTTAPPRWTEEKANTWFGKINWFAGFNYVPSTAANTTEFWQKDTFDLVTINRELGWAQDLGYTSIRVFLQYVVWKDDPKGMKGRFEQFLKIADKHKLTVVPVFFDDCAFGNPKQLDPYVGKQREPIPGMILPSWTPSPGVKIAADHSQWPSLQQYVTDIVLTYKDDKRIIMWDLFNEPMNDAKTGTPEFVAATFAWARAAKPTQPLTMSVWSSTISNATMLENSDIITFHQYSNAAGMKAAIDKYKKYNRPVICTEWMARANGSNYATDLPVFKQEKVPCYQWGFVNGRTQCQFPWWNKEGGGVDEKNGWFHDILYQDGKPYRQAEIDAIKANLKTSD